MNAPDPLRAAELRCLLDEATSPLRHDVRNRIASIRNLAYFVRRKVSAEQVSDRDPRIVDFLSKIEAEVQRTDDTIEQWSQKSHATLGGELQRVDLAECIRLAVSTARVASEIRFQIAPSAEPLEVQADLQRLAVAIRCLLENAAEATVSGTVRIASQREQEQCRIVVRDQGPGLSDAAFHRERFESSKPGHLGLGLFMARRIAAQFAGELERGAPASGAEVSLVLPLG